MKKAKRVMPNVSCIEADLHRLQVVLRQETHQEYSIVNRLKERYEEILRKFFISSRHNNNFDNLELDKISEEIISRNNIQEFLVDGTTILKPYSVIGDGNCLYRAAGLFFGDNSHLHLIFRLLTSIELALHYKYYINQMDAIWVDQQKIFGNKLGMAKSMFRFVSVDEVNEFQELGKAFRIEAIYNCKKGHFSSLICLQALSSVIGCPVKSVYVSTSKRIFGLFTRTFFPRDKVDDNILFILWSSSTPIFDNPNHFVLCLPSKSPVRKILKVSGLLNVDSFPVKRKKQSTLNFKQKRTKSCSDATVFVPGRSSSNLLSSQPAGSNANSRNVCSISSVVSLASASPRPSGTCVVSSSGGVVSSSSSAVSSSGGAVSSGFDVISSGACVVSHSGSAVISGGAVSSSVCSVSRGIDVISSGACVISSSGGAVSSSPCLVSSGFDVIPGNIVSSKVHSIKSSCTSSDVSPGALKMQVGRKSCVGPCCQKPIPRGEPVKEEADCHQFDIGLWYRKVHSISDSEKFDTIRNVWKPSAGYTFPFHVECKRHWRLKSCYVDSNSPSCFPWVVYSALYDGVFCLPCVLFQNVCGSGVNAAKKLVSEPFTRWNGAPQRWSSHQASPNHRNCYSTMQSFIRQMEGKEKTIDNIINSQRRELIKSNRQKLLSILKTVVLCGQQNFPLRGHRDDSKHLADKTTNSGNFQALLEFRVDSGDKILENHFKTAPKNATYRSKTIQNDLIASCGKYLRNMIISEIRQGRFYSIIADEASDSSHTEQLSVVLRFVDGKGEIREEFVEFIGCESVSGENLVASLKGCMKMLGLDLSDVRGQSYDGAGNMAGCKSGVSSRILSEYPKALYFHCSSHRLNLAVASCVSIRGVKMMMDTVKRCSDSFHFSPKKQNLLLKTIEESIPADRRTTLLDVCRTRWIQRIDGLERIQELMVPILSTFNFIAENQDGTYGSDARSDAGGLYWNMSSFTFAVHLVIVRKVLSYTYPLTFELQKKQIDVIHVYQAVDNVISTLQDCRDKIDEKHEEWYKEAVEFADQSSGTPPSIPRVAGRQKHRANYEASSPMQYYKLALTIPLLDQITSELQSRFSPAHRIHMNSLFVIPSVVVNKNDWKHYVTEFCSQYQSDLPQPLNVQTELDQWEVFWKKELNRNARVPDTITETLSEIQPKKEWYPNIYTVLCLVAVVPSSSNSCERSISRLKLLKTRLRSTMSQERLSGLALLNIHFDKEVDLEEILNIFARDYPHRLELELLDVLD